MKPVIWLFGFLMLSACASGPSRKGAESQDPEQRLAAYLASRARQDLERLDATDRQAEIGYQRARLLHEIGLYEHDYGAVQEAVALFETLEQASAFSERPRRHALMLAYHGSAVTLQARDHPGGWLVNNLTPVGFVRVYYVRKGVALLDRAVAAQPKHPVIRLIRANSLVDMPGFLGQTTRGLADYDLLMGWLEAPETNPDYAAILRDPAFRTKARYIAAQSYRLRGEDEKSARAFKRLLDEDTQTLFSEASQQALQTLAVQDVVR